jgi:hypothetical protein
LFVLALLLAGTDCAQEIAGQWQGAFKSGSRDLRVIVQFSKSDTGAWTGTLYRNRRIRHHLPHMGT